MEFWRIAQVCYVLFSFMGTGILTIAFVTVISWPEVRGRGQLLTALVVRLIAAAGYLVVGLLQLVSLFGLFRPVLFGEVMQVGYLLLAVISLAGDGLLLWAFISLAGSLRDLQPRAGSTNATPLGPIKEF
jgi:hypothetical protein